MEIQFEPSINGRYEVSHGGVIPLFDVEGSQCRVTVPDGYTFDGASIPRFAWSLVGTPFAPELIMAACAHDWLCEHVTTYEQRVIADACFMARLAMDGVPYWRRAAMYLAVRFYARVIWSWRKA